jgi:hypothetical protein
LILIAVASADIAPPSPPPRGEIAEDLPAPAAPDPPRSLLLPAVAVGTTVFGAALLGGFVVFRSRR